MRVSHSESECTGSEHTGSEHDESKQGGNEHTGSEHDESVWSHMKGE